MTPEEFARRLKAGRKELRELVRHKGPRIVGVRAVSFYKEGYRRGGYIDGGFHPWPLTQRQRSGGRKASDRYGALLSGRNRMFSATNYRTGNASVTIYNDTPYASVHNEGGETHPTVTPRMRKYFWAMYYERGGEGSQEAERYKWLALTKKKKLRVKIPQRKFIYRSKEVGELIRNTLKAEMKKILTK